MKEKIKELNKKINDCQECPLGKTAINHVVWGGNSLHPDVVFVGEAPGAEEDKSGKPFVGRAGKLLRDWISQMNIEKYAFLNILKCRPPNNRAPSQEETEKCIPHLFQQLELLNPKLIVALGKTSAQIIAPEIIADGKILTHIGEKTTFRGIRSIVFVHPAYVLRNQEFQPDLKAIAEALKEQKNLIEEPAMLMQKARNKGKFEMISPELAAIHYFANLAKRRFKDVNQKDICMIEGKKVQLLKKTQNVKPGACDAYLFYSCEDEVFTIHFWQTPEQVGTEEKNKISLILPISELEEEEDIEPQPYAPLHVHTQYSVGDGFGKPDYLAEMAYKKGFKAVAITDHGTMQGLIYVQEALLNKGIQPILGTEAYIQIDDSKQYYHLLILVKNKKGWENLLKIQNNAVRKNFYYRPRIDLKDLLEMHEGLIVASACQSGLLGKNILNGNLSQAEGYAKKLKEVFGDDFYLEFMPNRMLEQVTVNNELLKISKKYKIKGIITTDSHYPCKEDKEVHDALKAVSMKRKYGEASFSDDTFYLMQADEIKKLIDEHHPFLSSSIDVFYHNTLEVAKKCDFRIHTTAEQVDTLPKLAEDPGEKLKSLALEGAKTRMPDEKEYWDRFDLEINRISDKGYANYFLVVRDYVNYCKNNNIMVGPGRGSAGSSLVAYCLGITDVDPIEYDLLFDRFISEIRKDMPDIDLDFEDTKRDQVYSYLQDTYSMNNTAKIITFSNWHAKGALRDMGRIFNIPNFEIEKICKLCIVRSGGDARSSFCLADTFEEFEQGKQFKNNYPQAARIAEKLEGHIRHRGVHAGGMVVTEKPVSSYVPVERVGGEIVTAWDKRQIENFHLIKFDILGLKTLSVINETLSMVKAELPTKFDDKKVYEKIFSKGNCLGVFQFETVGMSKLSKQLGIDNFKTLYDATTLYRPGPLHSGETANYIARHLGKKEVKYAHDLLVPISKETHGMILYQEQVMQIMYDLGKFSWATAETTRKIMTKSQGKEMFNRLRAEFVANAKREHKMLEKEATKIFDTVSTFGSYGFNKSHAVEYSVISYWCGWLKAYFPLEFFSVLISKEGDSAKIADYVRNAREMGIEVLPPHINKSEPECSVKDEKIYLGFNMIKGIGASSVKKILKGRPYTFRSLIQAKFSKTIWENLAKAGALDEFGRTRKSLVAERERYHRSSLYKSERPEWSEKELFIHQLEVLDLPTKKPAIDYFSNPFKEVLKFSPLGDLQFDDYVPEVWVKGLVTFINFKQEGLEGSWTMFDNILERRYAHLNINDGTGNVLVHLSPEQYTYYKQYLERGAGLPIIIRGHSIPGFNKIYCDAMVVLDGTEEEILEVNKENPLLDYIFGKTESVIQDKMLEYPDCDVSVVGSVSYKVSKNKKAYARIQFTNGDKLMDFKLTPQIYLAGEVVVYRKQDPFMEVVWRKKRKQLDIKEREPKIVEELSGHKSLISYGA